MNSLLWYNLEKGGDLMRFLKIFEIIIILSFTLLFVYDYFPNIPLADAIPKSILIALIVGLYLFSLLFKKYRVKNNKEILKWKIFSTAYILFIMAFFTVLGGRSSTGMSLDNVFLWIVFLISVFEMSSQWKKVKQSEA